VVKNLGAVRFRGLLLLIFNLDFLQHRKDLGVGLGEPATLPSSREYFIRTATTTAYFLTGNGYELSWMVKYIIIIDNKPMYFPVIVSKPCILPVVA